MGKVIWIHATVPEEVSEGDFALDSEYLDAWRDSMRWTVRPKGFHRNF